MWVFDITVFELEKQYQKLIKSREILLTIKALFKIGLLSTSGTSATLGSLVTAMFCWKALLTEANIARRYFVCSAW